MSQPKANNPNPLFASEPWNLAADGYTETTMLVFEQFADEAIAASQLNPYLPQPQRSVTTLKNTERFKQEMEEAGYRNVEIRSITKVFPVGTTAEFWESMVKGSTPIQMMKKSIMSVRDQTSVRGEPVEPHSENTGETLWREKEKLALAWLEETLPALKGPLTSDVWLGMGNK